MPIVFQQHQHSANKVLLNGFIILALLKEGV